MKPVRIEPEAAEELAAAGARPGTLPSAPKLRSSPGRSPRRHATLSVFDRVHRARLGRARGRDRPRAPASWLLARTAAVIGSRQQRIRKSHGSSETARWATACTVVTMTTGTRVRLGTVRSPTTYPSSSRGPRLNAPSGARVTRVRVAARAWRRETFGSSMRMSTMSRDARRFPLYPGSDPRLAVRRAGTALQGVLGVNTSTTRRCRVGSLSVSASPPVSAVVSFYGRPRPLGTRRRSVSVRDASRSRDTSDPTPPRSSRTITRYSPIAARNLATRSGW